MEELDWTRYPSPEVQRSWLRSYLSEYQGVVEDEVTLQDIELWRGWVTKFTLASHLLWGVWGLLQACHSSLDFDYIT